MHGTFSRTIKYKIRKKAENREFNSATVEFLVIEKDTQFLMFQTMLRVFIALFHSNNLLTTAES